MADNGLTAGNKVAQLGEHFELTQEEWAKELGVTRGTVAAYKNRGNASPKTEKVRELSNRFGIPIRWFYDGGEGEPPVPKDINEAEMRAGDGHIVAVHPSRLTTEVERFATLTEVALPVWRGLIAGPDLECQFPDDQTEFPTSVPGFFLSGKPVEQFVVCMPTGVSMAPRIIQGDRVIVRLDPHPEPNDIIVARRPDGVNFIKVCRITPTGIELHSINDQFPAITLHEDGWTCRGVVKGIWKPYLTQGTNIEYNGGATLKA